MASIRQDYLGNYSQQNQNVGIGTSIPKEKLEIHGGVTAQQDLNVTGIATLTVASGFIERNLEYSENVHIPSGDSATLSGEIIVGSGLTMSVGTGATVGQGNVESLKVYRMFQPPTGGTNQRPVGKPGSLFYNTDFKTVEFFDGNSWRQVDNVTRRGRGLHAGGANPIGGSYLSTISSWEMSSGGDATSFGDLSVGGQGLGGFSSSTRGLFSGRRTPSNNPDDLIDYVTIASGGTAADFGDMTTARRLGATFSSSTRGIMAGGITPSRVNVIDYVEIATIGDAIDFGDTITACNSHGGGISNGTRGVFSRGATPTITKEIEFLKISSRGNSVLFGDLTTIRVYGGQSSNRVRGIFGGGNDGAGTRLNTIEYVTIASTGNGVTFGELTMGGTYDANGGQSGVNYSIGSANENYAFFSGGYLGGTAPFDGANKFSKDVHRLVFSTGGNTVEFAELAARSESGGALSDSHGGLGGY